ncbi:sulfite exporter TauE/SafE family protein [Helicobacter cholecystus]|uniref:Sulfite exporter TauE/SafE family protein n=1 Tax=Helicobacter cholecystus TaxID=45498 RepID=A0A3D8IW73_9HELI|nr:sulfite exporter TauE/SafE family protein [Helicobacter cholecystus]RDU69216.1 sulfite exporter TauE/SafE family protein [Helicobacter cholecystus]VEJ24289.1 putative thiol:disulfide interchange protein [Helicobacter cholecystus]
MELDYFLVFNIALSASLGHCIGMCGGIVLALNSKIAQNHFPALLCNFLYNIGRLSAYVLIGALCGGIGIVFEINPQIKGAALIFIGFLTGLFGALLLFAPKLLNKIEPSMPTGQGLKSFFLKLLKSQNVMSFFLLGLLNGFLPCGIVYYFALIALASGGVFKGAIIMGIFGVSTFLPMLFVGILSSLILNSSLKNIMLKISSIVMMIFGVFTIYKGMKLI